MPDFPPIPSTEIKDCEHNECTFWTKETIEIQKKCLFMQDEEFYIGHCAFHDPPTSNFPLEICPTTNRPFPWRKEALKLKESLKTALKELQYEHEKE